LVGGGGLVEVGEAGGVTGVLVAVGLVLGGVVCVALGRGVGLLTPVVGVGAPAVAEGARVGVMTGVRVGTLGTYRR